MKQPIYLDYDHIVQSIISFKIESFFNDSYIVSLITEAFNRLNTVPRFSEFNTDTPKYGNISLFINGLFCYFIKNGVLQLNCVEKYRGWSKYSRFISDLLEILSKHDIRYKDLQVRYISIFEEISIFDKINGKVELNAFPKFENIKLSFSFVVAGKPEKGIGNPIAHIEARNWIPSRNGDEHASVVDITVKRDSVFNNKDVLLDAIEFYHEQEKNVFFSFISGSFINELGPHYSNE